MVGKPDQEGRAQFTRPVRQIVMMLVVLALVGARGYVAFPRVAPVFLANLWLNGFIAFVFVLGIAACLAGVPTVPIGELDRRICRGKSGA